VPSLKEMKALMKQAGFTKIAPRRWTTKQGLFKLTITARKP
jgi:hypothetical protein